MSRFGLCRVGLTSQQNLAFYLWFAVVISPIPTPASSSHCLRSKELGATRSKTDTGTDTNFGTPSEFAITGGNSPATR
jgi:hypothetical protein